MRQIQQVPRSRVNANVTQILMVTICMEKIIEGLARVRN
jgi:hypothetical protein